MELISGSSFIGFIIEDHEAKVVITKDNKITINLILGVVATTLHTGTKKTTNLKNPKARNER